MLKQFKPSSIKTFTRFEIVFDDGHGNGFGFPCNSAGELLPMEEEMLQSYERCKERADDFVRKGEFVAYSVKSKEPASGVCICGRRVELYGEYYGATKCPCGRWYNVFGQELLSPEYWETDPSEEEYDYVPSFDYPVEEEIG